MIFLKYSGVQILMYLHLLFFGNVIIFKFSKKINQIYKNFRKPLKYFS